MYAFNLDNIILHFSTTSSVFNLIVMDFPRDNCYLVQSFIVNSMYLLYFFLIPENPKSMKKNNLE